MWTGTTDYTPLAMGIGQISREKSRFLWVLAIGGMRRRMLAAML